MADGTLHGRDCACSHHAYVRESFDAAFYAIDLRFLLLKIKQIKKRNLSKHAYESDLLPAEWPRMCLQTASELLALYDHIRA